MFQVFTSLTVRLAIAAMALGYAAGWCEAADVEIRLPAPASQRLVAGDGDTLLFYMRDIHLIAVVDTKQPRIRGYIQAHSPNVLIAAGREKVVVVEPESRLARAWDLRNLKQVSSTILQTEFRQIASIAIGSNVTDVMYVAGKKAYRGKVQVVGLDSFRVTDLFHEKAEWQLPPRSDQIELHVSAHGDALAVNGYGVFSLGEEVRFTADKRLKISSIGPRGKFLFGQGWMRRVGEAAERLEQDDRFESTSLRTHASGNENLFLQTRTLRSSRTQEALVHTVSATPAVCRNELPEAGHHDLFTLLPKSLKLAYPSPSNERIRFVDCTPTAASRNIPVVVSSPPATVASGQDLSYQIRCLGGKPLACRLISGPGDLKVSSSGLVTWSVPKQRSSGRLLAVVGVKLNGTEVRHELEASIVAPGADSKMLAGLSINYAEVPGKIEKGYLGGGGKYLVVTLPGRGLGCVIDITTRGIVGQFECSAEPLVAVGLEKLYVGKINSSKVEVWDLADLANKTEFLLPGDAMRLKIGSNSRGPIWAGIREQGPGIGRLLLIDTATLQPVRDVEMPLFIRSKPMTVAPDGFRAITEHHPSEYLQFGFGRLTPWRLRSDPRPPFRFFEGAPVVAHGHRTFDLLSLEDESVGGLVVPGNDGDEYLLISGTDKTPSVLSCNLRNTTRTPVRFAALPRGTLEKDGGRRVSDKNPYERIWFSPTHGLAMHVTEDKARVAFVDVKLGPRTDRKVTLIELPKDPAVTATKPRPRPPVSRVPEPERVRILLEKIQVNGTPGQKVLHQLPTPGGAKVAEFRLMSGPKGAGVSERGVVSWSVPQRQPVGLDVTEEFEILVAAKAKETAKLYVVLVSVKYK